MAYRVVMVSGLGVGRRCLKRPCGDEMSTTSMRPESAKTYVPKVQKRIPVLHFWGGRNTIKQHVSAKLGGQKSANTDSCFALFGHPCQAVCWGAASALVLGVAPHVCYLWGCNLRSNSGFALFGVLLHDALRTVYRVPLSTA